MYLPHYYTIVSGMGESEHKLVAFDKALLNAGIGDYNLVKVSSIIPPGCVYKDSIDLAKGSILYTAYAEQIVQNEQMGSTAVAIAFPTDFNENGVIFESSSYGIDAKTIVQMMCREAMSNRVRQIQDIVFSSITVKGIPNKYVCGISAVAMW